MFSCNKPMCLYKRQTHVSNYCKFQLSSDIEKTLVLLQCTLTLAKQSRHHIAKLMSWYLIGQSSGQQCVTISLCPLIYNNKQGINSANHLVSKMNIQGGNQLYSSLSQLTRQSFLMQTELPALLYVFKTDYELQHSENCSASRQK